MVKVAKILCPVDFSDTSRHAFDYAVLLAGRCRAELVVLHVMEEAPLATAYGAMPEAGMSEVEVVQRTAQQQLEELTAAAGSEATIRLELARGQTHKVILRQAEENSFDMIVMGTHGRRGLNRALFGSVTERVIRRAHCPVLIVRLPESPDQTAGARK
jgi:universal stress protein A